MRRQQPSNRERWPISSIDLPFGKPYRHGRQKGRSMKSWIKIVLILCIAVIVLAAVGAMKMHGPRALPGPKVRPLTSLTFERTPARLARGKYLVEAVLTCNHCHSPNDWTKHDAPIPPGMELAGQDMGSDPSLGHVIAPNLTPDPETGAGKW